MISTGNDIVALGAVNKKRTGEFRFYSKILSASEQALCHQPLVSTIPFETYVWLLWSVKESAYKYLQRLNPELIFSPTKIIISNIEFPICLTNLNAVCNDWEAGIIDNDLFTGAIVSESVSLHFRSKITRSWIATVVNDEEDFEGVNWGIRAIANANYETQSKSARAALLHKLKTNFTIDLTFEKSPSGYPILSGDKKNHPVSLSHDGCFVAYSFRLNPSAA